MSHNVELMTPECEYGYTRSQLKLIMGCRITAFDFWMNGQTGVICEGRKWNYETHEYEEACHGIAHGMVVYKSDVQRFLAGKPVID